MASSGNVAVDVELDEFVERFEREAVRGDADVAAFLPSADHPRYPAILRELLRVDLEMAWDRGVSRRVEHYADRFPALFRDRAMLKDVATEEYRQRVAAGEEPDPADYRRRFGLDLGEAEATVKVPGGCGWDGHRFPEVGEVIPPGYRLIGELGRGAFGRVYLAEQPDLADRKVAVKISSRLVGEARTLARLQHTHIVPVYSVHKVGDYQALVMPYLGRTTLADVIASTPKSARPTQRPASTKLPLSADANSVPEPTAKPEAVEAMSDDDKLRVAAALADGLAHAHERGILHRDLKPANILLADDGEPMLLDFNLAAEESKDVGFTGGTPRYMSPEQLRALSGPATRLDARSDLFSFGIVLHELFVGVPPFPDRKGSWAEIVPAMIADRESPLVVNHPSPAIVAMLTKCLQPNPDDRYPIAAALRDDLERHRANKPLATAREPWSRERLRKWVRRHPRLSSSGTVATLALLLIAVIGVGAYQLRTANRLATAREARVEVARARDAMRPLVVDPQAPVGQYRQARDIAAEAMRPFEEGWRLPPGEVEPLREDAAELLYYAAEATALLADRETNDGVRRSGFDDALTWNLMAQAAYPDLRPLRSVASQRAWILDRAGRPADRDYARSMIAGGIVPGRAGDYLQAVTDLRDGKFDDSIAALERLTRDGPPSYGVWMALGTARLRSHRDEAAVEAFIAAAALEPGNPWPAFYQGVAWIGVGRLDRAVAALTRFTEAMPNEPAGWLNLAIAHERGGNHAAALSSLDKVPASTRKHGVRHRALVGLKRKDEAAAEQRLLIESRPTDADEWTVRGEGRSPDEALKAAEDFSAALALDPDHPDALRGLAATRSEQLARPLDAVPVLERLVASPGGRVGDRAGLSVLLARLGKADAAREQARKCVGPDTPAVPLYQAASALAIVGDKAEAIALLRRVLRLDAGWADTMATDSDLTTVKDDAGFKALLDAARTLRGKTDE